MWFHIYMSKFEWTFLGSNLIMIPVEMYVEIHTAGSYL